MDKIGINMVFGYRGYSSFGGRSNTFFPVYVC